MTGTARGKLLLCHVFVAVPPEGGALVETLDTLGLRESFRREHPGQGTANLCYCFDNAYLELLWETDATALRSPVVAPTGLAERLRWRDTGANPFGIAVRTVPADDPPPFATWPYRPPYLPEGMSIPVAEDSHNPKRPLVFRSPGNQRPDAWPDGRAGSRQALSGLREIIGLTLELPADVPPGPALEALAHAGLLTLATVPAGGEPAMTLRLSGTHKDAPDSLRLP